MATINLSNIDVSKMDEISDIIEISLPPTEHSNKEIRDKFDESHNSKPIGPSNYRRHAELYNPKFANLQSIQHLLQDLQLY